MGELRTEKSPLVDSLCVTHFLICFFSSRGVVWIYIIPYCETRFWKNVLLLLGVDVRCDTSGLWENNFLDLFSNANQINDTGLGFVLRS